MYETGAFVTADELGNVFHVAGDGVVKLDESLQRVFKYPHGEVVTVDAAGNAYVAGAFTAPTDFGTGVVEPAGNVDVYLVTLSPSGAVMNVATLGDCGGDGVLDIARDQATGRIAVSGAAMGTIVVDANGAVLFRLAAPGKLAFDSVGQLVIAGTFAGGVDLGNGHRLSTSGAFDFDGFIARYDASGRYQLSFQLGDVALPYTADWGEEITAGQTQAVVGVAIGPDDSIAVTGAYYKEANLFGQEVSTIPGSPEGGTFTKTFVAKIDASGNVAFVHEQFDAATGGIEIGGVNLMGIADGRNVVTQRPGTAIAVDANGDIYVSNNQEGNVPPFAYAQLTKHDGVTGAEVWGLYNNAGPSGYGLGVAIDACGNVVWADREHMPELETDLIYLSKLAH